MVRGSRIRIVLSNRDFQKKLESRLARAENVNYKDFQRTALDITRDVALKKIKHRYLGNRVGGYVENIKVEVRKNGFDIVAKAPHSDIVENGTGPRTARSKPMVFRGYYPNRKLEQGRESFFAQRFARKEKAKVRNKSHTSKIKTLTKLKTMNQRQRAAAQTEREAKTFSELRKQVSLQKQRAEIQINETPWGKEKKEVVKILKPDYAKVRKQLRKGMTSRALPYGIYTVYAWKVRGYKGLNVLRTAGEKVKKELRRWLRKRTETIITERSYGHQIRTRG